MPEQVGREQFETWIADAVAALPPSLRDQMDNVAIVLDDETPPRRLLGLYHGIPKTGRSLGYSGVLPDKITIYQKAIEANVRRVSELPNEVRRVVWHEIGHHFGISDRRLRQLEKNWEMRK
ncbi:MAG: metallopeptidase family protein [Patescibacteria group bacterium]|nr:metallopeptidase family protein [Patescibacteria group bacterium]